MGLFGSRKGTNENQKPDLGYMDMHERWFQEAIEKGKPFEAIHRERVNRDEMADLYEEEDGYRPVYNPRTRKWE